MAMYGPPQGPPVGPPQGPPFGPPQGPGYGPVQAMPPAGPPKKKGMSTGCVVALVVVLVFFGSIGAIVLLIGYKVSQDKDVQNVFGAIGEAATIMAEAQSAPGTAELRAIGCEQAMALDPAKMLKIADRFVDAGGSPPSATPPEVERIVMCQVGAFGTAPSCDDAARVYVRGAAPRGKFMLTVQQGSSKNKQCSGVYSASGVLVGPAGAGMP